MAVLFATFERLKGKGGASYKKGGHLAAEFYPVNPAGCMIGPVGSEPSLSTKEDA